jgi:acetolactate synthase I/II/III large subunit
VFDAKLTRFVVDDSNKKNTGVSRRAFIGSSVAAGAASLLTQVPGASANPDTKADGRRPVSKPPSDEKMAREVGDARPSEITEIVSRAASDLMVQVLRNLEIEYVALNPGSSFEGLQESLINFGDPPNRMPEIVSAMHEGSAVDMAHGYARAEGKPMVALIQGTVGLQNASLPIYQAFHGHAPMIVLVGNDEENFLKVHTGEDIAGLVRPYTKWDAQPESLEETLAALVEAYRQAMTPPCAPVLVVLNSDIQKQSYEGVDLPTYKAPVVTGVGEPDANEIAKALLAAVSPRISVGRLRSPAGIEQAVRLAELVGASVKTMATYMPMSFPQRHPLVGPGADKSYDYHLGLEQAGAHLAIHGPHLRDMTGRDPAGIGFGWKEDPNLKRRVKPEKILRYDAEASLPVIIAAVEANLTEEVRKQIRDRTRSIEKANKVERFAATKKTVEKKRAGWNGSPVSLARIYAELWPLIKDLDWCLASPSNFSGRHHVGLWDHDRPHSYLGVYPAAGVGYCLGASVGAALAAKSRDRIVINIQGDGDFNYLPGAVWTAAHHELPILTIMHNNRAWHMEYMYLQYMAGVRGRGTDRAHIGTTFRDPYINYAKLADGYGMKSEGPISDPNLLVAALTRGIESVKSGEPYLIDVLTQPR